MLNKAILFVIFALVVNVSQAQTEASWADLMDINFKDVYLESEDIYVYYPLFKEKQKSLADKTVAVTGYIIPVDVEDNLYVLSAFPFSACFFCGNAGPESVMAVYFKSNDRTYKVDERLTLVGTLELNETDIDELVYVLRDAVPKD